MAERERARLRAAALDRSRADHPAGGRLDELELEHVDERVDLRLHLHVGVDDRVDDSGNLNLTDG